MLDIPIFLVVVMPLFVVAGVHYLGINKLNIVLLIGFILLVAGGIALVNYAPRITVNGERGDSGTGIMIFQFVGMALISYAIGSDPVKWKWLRNIVAVIGGESMLLLGCWVA